MKRGPVRRLPARRARPEGAAARKGRGGLFPGALALLIFVVCGLLVYRLEHPGAALGGGGAQTEKIGRAHV